MDQRGGTEIYIVVVVILIAFLMAGGEFLLGNAFPLPDSLNPFQNTPANGGNGGSGGNGGNSTNPTTWSVDLSNRGCSTGKNITTATVTGTASGYISVEISNGAGGFAPVQTRAFTNLPTSVYELNLPNDLGFNTTAWRVQVFQGGTNSNGNFSGGTVQASKNGSPTGC